MLCLTITSNAISDHGASANVYTLINGGAENVGVENVAPQSTDGKLVMR